MVSRKKILSRSRDDLNLDDAGYNVDEEEDVWYQKEKLYKDHILEVLEKWDSIDDEIWAKVIVLERNRRVAKAYARAPVLTVNGSDDGFDGFRIGVNGFDNPMRDPKTEEFKNQIGQGCKIKMDETGNILIKRFGKSPIYVKNALEENAVSNDIIKLPSGSLDFEKPFKLFDMKKFQQNVNRELKRNYPERRKLECQCISTIAFVKNEEELLDSPIWIMLINVVALEMLRAKIPVHSATRSSAVRHGSEPQKRFTASGSSDEDPYSLTPSGSSGSSGKGNHRAITAEKELYGPQNWAKTRRNITADYSDDMEDENNGSKSATKCRNSRNSKSEERKNRLQESSGDDPYYCGMRARVPNFVQQHKKKEGGGKKLPTITDLNKIKSLPSNARSTPNLQSIAQLPGPQPFWWHSRLYPDSGIGASSSSVSTSNNGGGHYSTHVNYRNMPVELPTYHYPGYMSGHRGYRNSMSNVFRANPVGMHSSKSSTAMFQTHQGWE